MKNRNTPGLIRIGSASILGVDYRFQSGIRIGIESSFDSGIRNPSKSQLSRKDEMIIMIPESESDHPLDPDQGKPEPHSETGVTVARLLSPCLHGMKDTTLQYSTVLYA
jgi:hypothetical protein